MVKGIVNSILTILLIIALKVKEKKGFTEFRPNWNKSASLVSMVYVDGRFRESGSAIDTFFDRVNAIVVEVNKTRSNEVSSVFIDSERILTSFNSLKVLSEDVDVMKLLRVSYLRGRCFNQQQKTFTYKVFYESIKCARQVVPPKPNEKLPSDLHHGIHSPLHDLMVLRIEKTIEFLTPPYARHYDLDHLTGQYWDDKSKCDRYDMGPVLTELATKTDELTENLMFASIGHVNDYHIKTNWYLEKEEAFSDDKVVTDCDEWFPRSWGHFICIRNVNQFAGIASGGVLFSEGKLFGIGSFALFKGNDSVLVFTDVRPYEDLLNKTCIVDDQNLKLSENAPATNGTDKGKN